MRRQGGLTRQRARRAAGLALALALLVATSGFAAAGRRYAFTTFEGEVVEMGEHPGEGELQLVSLDLAPDGGEQDKLTVLLGPVTAWREIGFEVEPGDRVRVRVLLADEGQPVKAQKILNLSRRIMVRLRTMHDVPLWDSTGAWQGGPGRAYRGGRHGADRGAGRPPPRGPGGRR
jgi:hypothetical protein